MVKIHYEINGQEDSFILSGDNVEEIKDRADREIKKRGIQQEDCWSEILN